MSEVWTFARVLQRMYERQATGILRVSTPDGEAALSIQDGKIVGYRDGEATIVSLTRYLVESGMVAPNELLRLEKRAEKSGQSLEQTLIDSGMLQEEVLRRFVELATRERILALFQRSGITCKLQKERPISDLWLVAMPIPYFLKTGAKRARHWPALHKRLPRPDLVLDKRAIYNKTVLGAQQALLMGGEDGAAPVGGADAITGNERIVYYYLNGKKTLEQLGFATCLGPFETARALARLLDKDYAFVLEEEGRGERLRARHVVFPAALRLVAWGLVAALMVSLAWLRPGALARPGAFLETQAPALRRGFDHLEQVRVERLMEAGLLVSPRPVRYPDSFQALQAQKLLSTEQAAALAERWRLVPDPEVPGRRFGLVPLR